MTDISNSNKKPNILITGGQGFLGSRIVDELHADDSPLQPGMVRVLDIKGPEKTTNTRIEYIKGDITSYEDVKNACSGMDMVIHSAAIIDWGTKPESEVLAVNVTGTENVIRACKETGIKYLVYTSSLDAVYSGKPLVNVDETLAYPTEHKTVYCKSKYLSEKMVLSENKDRLLTAVLRPSDIYGEGDPYHIESLIDMARTGFYVRLGNGSSKCQHIYVGNMAYAHVQLAKALWEGNNQVAGQVYFITDGEGANFFKFFDHIVAEAGYRIFPKNLWLPKGLAYAIGSIAEFMALLIRPFKHYNPKFSRFAVTYTCTDFTFTSNKAKTDFGFIPKYSLEEAIERTARFYSTPAGQDNTHQA